MIYNLQVLSYFIYNLQQQKILAKSTIYIWASTPHINYKWWRMHFTRIKQTQVSVFVITLSFCWFLCLRVHILLFEFYAMRINPGNKSDENGRETHDNLFEKTTYFVTNSCVAYLCASLTLFLF